MREGSVGFRHLVRVFSLLDGRTGAFRRFLEHNGLTDAILARKNAVLAEDEDEAETPEGKGKLHEIAVRKYHHDEYLHGIL